MVDEILGQQQVVIKSMEQNFRKIDGIAGATILGDGTVGFILDVRGLIEMSRRMVPVAA
jgi:two-component system chemotaxis sensor kinase CheA